MKKKDFDRYMDRKEKKKIKGWFEANYLDGDKIQDGQMIASSVCFEAILHAIADFQKEG